MSDKSSKNRHIEVIARGVMFHVERVLLCKNVKHGYFYLPGGHVELGETAAQALVREMQEEAALAVVANEVVAIDEHLFEQNGRARHEINVYLAMKTLDSAGPSSIQSVEEHIAFEWCELSQLDIRDIRPSHAKAVIRTAAAGKPLAWSSVRE